MIARQLCVIDDKTDSKSKQKTLHVVTIAMICFTLASIWKFQYFRRHLYNSVEHLWWSFYWENSKPLSIFTKSYIIDASLGSKYAFAFWRLFKRFISLKYFTLQYQTLEICYFFKVLYFFNSSKMLLNI